LSGIVIFRMLPHTSRMLMLSGFSGHVHIGHVYWFSRIPRCMIKCVRLEYFCYSMGAVSYNGTAVSTHFYVPLPNVWLDFFALCFLPFILVSCVARLALSRAIVRIPVFPIWFVGLAFCSCLVVMEGGGWVLALFPVLVFPAMLFLPFRVGEEVFLSLILVCERWAVLRPALFALALFSVAFSCAIVYV